MFLPRDAMHKRGLCRHAVSVCLSVCLCVCHVRELRQTNKDIFEFFFHRRVAMPFWFFRVKRNGDIPTGTLLTGGRMQGYSRAAKTIECEVKVQYAMVSRRR